MELYSQQKKKPRHGHGKVTFSSPEAGTARDEAPGLPCPGRVCVLNGPRLSLSLLPGFLSQSPSPASSIALVFFSQPKLFILITSKPVSPKSTSSQLLTSPEKPSETCNLQPRSWWSCLFWGKGASFTVQGWNCINSLLLHR